MNEQLLCYLPGPLSWSGTLDRLCREEGIRLIPVSAVQCSKTVGSLLGLPTSVRPLSAGAAPKEPVLVLCGFTPGRMDAFLTRLRAGGVPSVLQAVVTPTNLGWTFSALAAELARERAELEG